ncbi:DUF4192 domain-containing protein [Actinosynnema sp. CA-248983]
MTDPGQLIAAIPHLLGFYPTDSIVVLVLQDDHVDCTLRTDCPTDPTRYRDIASQLALAVRDPVDARVAVVVVGTPVHHRDLATHLRDALTTAGTHALLFGVPEIARGARWYDYDHAEHAGVLPDPAMSVMAVHAVAKGLVTLPSREALVAQTAPDPHDVLARRAAMLDATRESLDIQWLTGDRMDRVRHCIERIVNGDEQFSDADIIRACHALTMPGVRDACLSMTAGPHAEAAEKLWLILTRQCPAPARAEAATLLAASAYSRGDGTLAAVALDRALTADPRHSLARLLHNALDRGIRPERIRTLITSTQDRAI